MIQVNAINKERDFNLQPSQHASKKMMHDRIKPLRYHHYKWKKKKHPILFQDQQTEKQGSHKKISTHCQEYDSLKISNVMISALSSTTTLA